MSSEDNKKNVGINVSVDFSLGEDLTDDTAPSQDTFHVLILGNFGGNAKKTRIRSVDRYTINDLFQAMNISLTVPGCPENDQDPIHLFFDDIDDFHPDQLIEKDQQIPDIVRSTFALPQSAQPAESAGKDDSIRSQQEDRDLVQDLLDGKLSANDSREKAAVHDPLQRLVNEAVGNHIVSKNGSSRDAEKTRNLLVGRRLREILHNAEFQELESTWRALYFLVKNLSSSSGVKLSIVDIDKETISKELSSPDAMQESSIYRLLAKDDFRSGSDFAWHLIIADFDLVGSESDLNLIKGFGILGKHLKSTVLAPAQVGFLGNHGDADDDAASGWDFDEKDARFTSWQALRQEPGSEHVGLIFPRFRLRLPYGGEASPCENYNFEEFASNGDSLKTLWGHCGVLYVLMIGELLEKYGRQVKKAISNKIIGDLPYYAYRKDGNVVAAPCGEVFLSKRVGEKIKSMGLIPVFSIPESDQMVLGDLIPISNKKGPFA